MRRCKDHCRIHFCPSRQWAIGSDVQSAGTFDDIGVLGKFLLEGEGTEKNTEEAVKWLTIAAEKGNAYAQFNLAGLYASGIGVQRDLQAYSLFALAGKTLDVSKQLTQISSRLRDEE